MTKTERSLQPERRGTSAKTGTARRVPRYWFPAHRLAVVDPAPQATKAATPGLPPAPADLAK